MAYERSESAFGHAALPSQHGSNGFYRQQCCSFGARWKRLPSKDASRCVEAFVDILLFGFCAFICFSALHRRTEA